MLSTRIPLLLYLLLANLAGFSQATSDSLRRKTTTEKLSLSRKDSLEEKFQQIQNRFDSLRQLPYRTADSLAVVRYVSQQRDSATQRVQRWQTKQDSLLSPLDTFQQKIDDAQCRLYTTQNSLNQRAPLRQITEPLGSKVAATLPEEVTQTTANASVTELLPQVSVPKLTSQLPNLPPLVHSVREHAPESELLQLGGNPLGGTPQSQGGLFDFSDRQAFAQQQQRAQLQQRVMAAAKDHFAEHGEVLQDAQQQLGKLKKKYSVVNGDTQQKRSSLQGTPLGKRLVYGGTMQLQRTPSLSIDLAPQLAYQFNQRISSGVGLVYRLAPEGGIKKLRQQLADNNAIYGGRLYGEYEVVRSLLLHGEYERLSHRAMAANDSDLIGRLWQSSLLFGIGKTYRIAGKWQGSVLLLYNFRHRQQNAHTRPWVVRFGLQRISSN